MLDYLTAIMKRLLLPLLFLLALLPGQTKADHFIGSDFTWECLGGDTFKVILTFYQDCNGCGLGINGTGCAGTCGIPRLDLSSSCGSKTANFSHVSHKDITPVCDEQCTRCTNCACSFQFGIRQHVLTAIVYVGDHRKNGCCEFTISYRSCCRSLYITTGAANAWFYVDAKFNACQDPCDNSPKFTNAPIAILCLGSDFIYNQGATDSDIDSIGGLVDSLVYSYDHPMATSTSKTTWSGGYDYNKPLYFLGFPKANAKFPRGFHLDAQTGDMMFRPMKVEITVLALRVTQFRDGKEIGYTRRDIQIIVIKCPDNSPPVLSGINCKDPTKPANFTTSACAGQKICFTVCSTDKDKDDTVSIDWNGGISGATFDILNKGDQREKGRFCWTPDESKVSKFPYSFVVTAKDDACPVNGYTARSYQITVKAPPKGAYDTLIYDCGKARFTVRKTGNVNIAQYIWGLNGNQIPRVGADFDTIHTKFQYPGKKKFSLTLIGKNGCNNIYQDTITIPKFVNVFTRKDTTVCAGATLNFQATIADSTGNVKVDWSNNAKLRRTSITVGSRDTFIIVNVKDDLCDNSDTCYIKVNTPPVIDLGNSQRICPGEEHVLRVTHTYDTSEADSMLSYHWYQNDFNSYLGNFDTLVVKDSALYYVRAEDSLGCESTDDVMIFVNPKRNWLPDDTSVCDGDSFILRAKFHNPVTSYEWYNSPSERTPIGTDSVLEGLTLNEKFFGVRWSEKIGGLECQEYDSVKVAIKELPVVDVKPLPEICESAGELNLINLGVPVGGEWSDTSKTKDYVLFGKFDPGIAGTKDNKRTPHMLRYYYQHPTTKCSNKDSGVIVVKPLPEVQLNKDEIQICNTEGDRELDQYVDLPKKGEWKGTGVVENAGKYYFSLDVAGRSTGEYELVYHIKSVGLPPICENSDTLLVKVIEVPDVKAGSYDSVCVDDAVLTLDKADPTGASGTWYYKGKVNNQWTTLGGNEVNPADHKGDEGVHYYSYIYKVPGSECADTATTSVKINPLPIPAITTKWLDINGENRICELSDPMLLEGENSDVSSRPGADSWAGIGVEPQDDDYYFNPQTAGLGSHVLTYEVYNKYGCKDEATETVVVDPALEISFTNEEACLGENVQLSTERSNISELKWHSSGEGSFENSSLDSALYKPDGRDLGDTFTIYVTAKNPENICPSVTYAKALEIYPQPEIDVLLSDTAGCGPLEVTFTNQSTIAKGQIVNIEWRMGDGSRRMIAGNTRSPQVHLYGEQGRSQRFQAELVFTSDQNCKDSARYNISTYKTPIAAFVPQPGLTTIVTPSVNFKNKSSHVNKERTGYSWFFDDHKSDEDTSTAKDVYYHYSDTGTYAVRLIASNVYNTDYGVTYHCVDTIIRKVIIEPEILVFIPNVFSPDNSGPDSNNYFQPVVSEHQYYEVQVFNRWGERMWQSTDTQARWDGTFNGEACAIDAYVYVVRVTNKEGKEYEFTGTVSLIR